MIIRPITYNDDQAVASLVREVLTEFGANRSGFAWDDAAIDCMTDTYERKGRGYWVIDSDGMVMGGGGIAEFDCNKQNCCELQKMYLLPEARGFGWGEELLDLLLQESSRLGYNYCYLETLSNMKRAAFLYQKKGFKKLLAPLGDSGHGSCDTWYMK